MKIISAVDVVKKHLESQIIKGVLKPGERIKEIDVSEKLNVSRPPIREALKMLEGEGLITRIPNKGVFVTHITDQDIWEVSILRVTLHVLATALALPVLTPRDIQKLEKLVDDMDDCLNDDSLKSVNRYQELNSRFHKVFVDASKHERLVSILGNLENQVRRHSLKSFMKDGHMKYSNDQHHLILERLKKGEQEAVVSLTRRHFLETSLLKLDPLFLQSLGENSLSESFHSVRPTD
jgi:DNA-binding GntR family transcriptional regulator